MNSIFLISTYSILQNTDIFTVSAFASRTRADEVEPNNNFGNATLIMNTTFTGEATDLDSVDYYRVVLHRGQTVKIEFTTDLSGVYNLTLQLYDKDGNSQWTSGQVIPNKMIRYNFTVNQAPNSPYYIGVHANDFGNKYTLKTTISSQNDAGSGGDAPDTITTGREIYQGTITGFLAGLDVDDFYWIKVNPGKILDFNFSVSSNSDPLNFAIFNNTDGNPLKSSEKVNAGKNSFFQYTTGGNSSQVYYINAHLSDGDTGGYSISVQVTEQNDGLSYQDAGDTFETSTRLIHQGISTGWLAGGSFGMDNIDIYSISIPAGNHTLYLNITPDMWLDIIVYLYNNNSQQLTSKNPGPGDDVNITQEFDINEETVVYIKLEVPPSQSSKGDYKLEYSIIKTIPPNPDLDNDNIPNDWEIKYGLNPNDPTDADKDTDSDEFTNLQEFNSQTDPTDPKSHPPIEVDYSHLTEAACLRTYTDQKNDVSQWSGIIDESAEGLDITSYEFTNKPSYDLLSLESQRKNEALVVNLMVTGKIENLGSIESLDNDSNILSGTFYEVVFVNKTFQELQITKDSLPQFIEESKQLINTPLTYVNETFLGPTGTSGQIKDAGQTISWLVPLTELTLLPADFGVYAFVYHFEVSLIDTTGTRSRNPEQYSFISNADSMGTGSKVQEKQGKIEKKINIDGNEVEVSITTKEDDAILSLIPVPEPPEEYIPKNAGSLKIYFDATLIGDDQPESIFITIKYTDDNIPIGYKEKNIKVYYYVVESGKWIKVQESGVWTGNNTAWARPEHLTVFTPMAERETDTIQTSDLEIFSLYIIVLFITIVVVVILIIVIVVLRSRKGARSYQPTTQPTDEPQRRAITPEFFPCPRCGEDIEVPYTEEPKAMLECPRCHSKGKIDNPYLVRRGADYPEPRDEYDEYGGRDYDRSEREYERDYEREYDRDRDYHDEYRRGGRDYQEDYYEDYERDEHEYEQEYDQDYEEGYERDYDRDYDRERPRRGAERDVDLEYSPPAGSTDEGPAIKYDEDEDYEIKECPKCGADIPIPYVEDERIMLKCPKCGAKGKIKNPYLG